MEQETDKIITMNLNDGSQVEFHISSKLEDHLRKKNDIPAHSEIPEEMIKEFLLKFIKHAKVEEDGCQQTS